MSLTYIIPAVLTILLLAMIISVIVKSTLQDHYSLSKHSYRSNLNVQTYLNTLHGPIEDLQEQCLHLFGKGSFWLDLSSNKGDSLIEVLVRQIFEFHVPNEYRHSPNAGAEFWVQIRDQTKHDSLPFHFDKDESLFLREGLMINPHIATVTYLSQDRSPPTVVTDLTVEDVDVKTDNYFKTAKSVFVSFPERGKHLAFQGNMYHGVLGRINSQGSANPRITLLVNIWLTGRPSNTKILARWPNRSCTSIRFDPSVKEIPTHVGSDRNMTQTNQPVQDIPQHILKNPKISSCIISY